MMLLHPARITGAAIVAAGIVLVAAAGGSAGTWSDSLRCTGQADARALDAQLAAAGSPLAGDGAAFVREGLANDIDPRALVAIAAHETMLETYGPAQAVRNPFGLGPGIAFDDESDAIAMAARTLARYSSDGLVTIPQIGARWAPVGAANDPGGLNGAWPSGVSAFFTTLGGDPGRPVQASAQDALPACAPAGATAAPATPGAAPVPAVIPAVTPTDGPGVVVMWGGRPPAATGAGPSDGADPRTGAPAVLPGFAFPIAPPEGSPVGHAPSGQGLSTITSAPGALVVAPITGTLRRATPDDASAGIGFWVQGPDRDVIGMSPLASYEPGINEGVAVTAGQPIGRATGATTVTWRRDGVDVAIAPMLDATRPSG